VSRLPRSFSIEMMPAARITDSTGHPGVIAGPGVTTVLIGGLPAAVLGDTHTCAIPPPPSHPPTPIVVGSVTVLIAGRPAARVGDTAGCGAPIVSGEFRVLVGG
jgi:uncharacterized Zn-binding protein involved in type VI secretion